MSLRPCENIQKILISTTSSLVGEFEIDSILIAHAWPNFSDRTTALRREEGPNSRSTYVISFQTEIKTPTPGDTIPDYTPIGDMISSCMSVLYGKRFDNHGLIESFGIFRVPDQSDFNDVCNPNLPHNQHKPRIDYSIPLNLCEVSRIIRLFASGDLDAKFLNTFRGAAKFYHLALQSFEKDPEVSYLHLITAAEILSNFHEFDRTELLDSDIRVAIERIQVEMRGGEKLARLISKRLLQIKKRFTATITNLVDDDFFNRSESSMPYGRFEKESFKTCIDSAYDLRSMYVHTGQSFGAWVSLDAGVINSEVQIGEPIVQDKAFMKTLSKSPTLIGLERVVRYCLLRFAEVHGALTQVEPSD